MEFVAYLSAGIFFGLMAVSAFIVYVLLWLFHPKLTAIVSLGFGLSCVLLNQCAAQELTVTANYGFVNTYDGGALELGYRTEPVPRERFSRAARWHFQGGVIESSPTFTGRQDQTYILTASREFIFNDYVFGRFGLAYTPDNELVGPVNFRFGGGIMWGPFELEYTHASSADIYSTNWGLDMIGFRFKF